MHSLFHRIAWMIMLPCAFLLDGRAWSQTSTLVHEDGGVLTYGTYANQGQANAVNTVPDFSRAGYKGGGEEIPFVPTVITVNAPSGGDDTALIQNAIDSVAAMGVQANGFRGAVLIKAGNYQVASTIRITASGIVIRGEGNQASGGTKITMTATVQDNLFEVAGSGSPSTVSGSIQSITDAYVPVGAKTFTVADASVYSVGDPIRLCNTMNEQWIMDIGMNNISGGDPAITDWTAADYQLLHERTITAINGNTLTIDAPVVQAIETQYGGGNVRKYTFSGQLTNIGFESLRLESAYLSDTDEAHGWIGIKFNNVRNVWVRQVTGRYFGFGVVSLNSTTHYATIEDCAMLDPKSMTVGGRKYSFNIDGATYVLMQRCYTRGGRHDFVSGSQTPGPNVFVDCMATNTFSDVGPHHRYATGQLYDNVKCGALNVQNRRNSGTGHGWSGAQVMFWNCDATSIVSESPQAAMNWAVGCKGTFNDGTWINEADGIRESNGVHVTPRSLYYRQLQERLGLDAVRKVIVPNQDAGPIWTGLGTWAGEGLYGNNVVAWASPDWINPPDDSVYLTGRVRNLKMLETGVSVQWSKLSGPGTVTFGNDSLLNTTATFSGPGSYVIRLTATAGAMTATYDLSIRFNTPPTANAGTDRSVVSSVSTEWTPAATATAAWYDASDPSTLWADASAQTPATTTVARWDDKSGKGNHASQASASNRPRNDTVSINGLRTVSFRQASAQHLSAPNHSSLQLDGSGGVNVFAVMQYGGYVNQGSALNVAFSKGQILSTTSSYGIRVGSGNQLAFKSGNDLLAGTGDLANQTLLFSGTSNLAGQSSVLRINGADAATATTASVVTSNNTDPLYIGRDGSASRHANCDFGEIIVLGGVLDADQRQRIEGYLAHKWGLETSLPSGHPYRITAPSADIASASLSGTIHDDDGDSLTVTWSKVSGPGVVTFTDATSASTSVGFSANGIYVLRLAVNDGYTTTTDDIQITVRTPFDAWVLSNGTGSETFTGDSNGDGIADGLAWLLGSASPTAPAHGLLPSSQESTGDLVAAFRLLKSTARGYARLKLQYSKDLGITDLWTTNTITVPDATSTVGGVSFVITPSASEDYNQIQATIPASAAGGGSGLFMRLLAEP